MYNEKKKTKRFLEKIKEDQRILDQLKRTFIGTGIYEESYIAEGDIL